MNDDTLILYYYGDGLRDDERASIEAALENDASLRQRYRELCRSLDRFSEAPETQAPPHMMARWHRGIERAAAGKLVENRPAIRAWHFPSFGWGALAAALALGVGIGSYFADGTAPDASTADTANRVVAADPSSLQAAAPASFSRGLQVHLRESRRDIMHLAADEHADRTMLIMDILRQNRLFERAAQENNAEDVARVLRAFEPVLLQLANQDISEEDAAALKAKLTFELNVMLTKMARSESDDTQDI